MESADENQPQEAHVLIFPLPFQGHINTMLRLAEALSFAGDLRISFLNTEHNHRLLSSFSRRPNLRFLSIPDGLPDDEPRSVHRAMDLIHSLRTGRSMDSFRALLLAGRNLDSDGDGWPPVTCVIVDGGVPFAMDAAQALGLPAIVFRTISASSLWVYLHFPQMIEAGELPFPAASHQSKITQFISILKKILMESADENQQQEAHLLIFPVPFQGHINTMLRLAEALSFAGGLRISFLNTEHNHRLLSSFSHRANLRFLSIPDGLPDDEPRSVHRAMDLVHSLRTGRSMDSFRALLLAGRNLDSDGDGWPPVTCVVVDGAIPFAMDAAQALGLPAIVFRTISASSLWVYLHFPHMIEAGELPFPAYADLDEPIKSVPAMEDFLRRRDLPTMCRKATKAEDEDLRFFADITASAMRSQGLILNTSNTLEAPILSQIRSLFPTTYAVGPLHALVESITSSAVSASLLAEDRSALSWLDAQPERSVVYVSFGSLTQLTLAEFLEFWHGFVDSGHRFLWVVRPDMVAGGAPAIKMTESEERLRLVAWAPQQEVLRHRAVGCFFTHSGWNSTAESAAAGVPMVCWPWSWDQLVNSRLVGEVWKVGLDMKDLCRREMVERMVRAAMEGEKAEELRQVAAEMAAEIGRSVGEGGDSRLDFERLVRDILSLSLRASTDRGQVV